MLLLPTACDTLENEDATLELTQSKFALEKGDTLVKVGITTNQEEWSYTQAQKVEWLDLKRVDNELLLTLQANNSEETRRTAILLRAGDAQQRVEIEQKGETPAFALDQAQITFSNQGGTRTLNFASLGKKVNVELIDNEIPWLSLRKITNTLYSLRAEAQPEVGSEVRRTKLIVTLGQEAKEVEVIQEAQKYYMLPIIRTQLNVLGMIEEEKARGSQLIRHPGGENLRFYHFAASAHEGNPGFIEYDYAFAEEERYTKASVVYKGTARFLGEEDGLNPEFVQYMKSEGFERIEATDISETLSSKLPSGILAFFAKTLAPWRCVAYVTKVNENQDTRVEVRYERAKTPDNNVDEGETFSKLPLAEQINWISSKAFNFSAGKKKADIEKWEQAQGSTYDEKESGSRPGFFFSSYQVKPTPERPEFVRGYVTITPGPYWINNLGINLPDNDPAINDVEGLLAFYENTSYVYRFEQGERVIIPAAKKLFAENGFPWKRRQRDGTDLFQNPKTGLSYVVDIHTTPAGKRVLRVRVTYVGG